MRSTLSVEERKKKFDEYQRAYRKKNGVAISAWQREYYRICKQQFADKQRWIRAARKKIGYSQAEVARTLGCSQAAISKLESGASGLEVFAKKDALISLLGKEREETCTSAT